MSSLERRRVIGSSPRSHTVACVAAGIACLVPAAWLHAQAVRGAVRDSATGERVAGAVVIVTDSAGRTLDRLLTDATGRFTLAAPPSARALHVLRIGFRPWSAALAPSAGQELAIRMAAIPVMLEPVRVTTVAHCRARRDGAATVALLSQVRTGLLAVVVARETNEAAFLRARFDRRLDPGSNRVLGQRVRLDSVSRSAVSFEAARRPADFVAQGFAAERDGTTEFFAPDADVLLDSAFALGYCFGFARATRARPTVVGLTFEPARRQEGRVDIAGTLWVDTATRTLTEMTFRYVGLGRELEAFEPGGRLSFRAMTTGLVLIDRWTLRLAGLAADTVFDVRARRETIVRLANVGEVGGELARARWPSGLVWHAPLGALRGTVLRDGGPAIGIVVVLEDTDYRAVTDSAGRFEMRDLLPGLYTVVVADPRLQELGLTIPTGAWFLAERDSTATVAFAAPTIDEYVHRRCAASGVTADGGVRIIGRALTASSEPVPHARVALNQVVSPGVEQTIATYRTREDGLFQFCPPDVQVGQRTALEVTAGQAPAVRIERTLTDSLTVVRVQLPR